MEYTLIRQRRKTLSLRVEEDGTAVVRAPRFVPRREIDRFVESRAGWITQRRQRMAELALTPEQEAALRRLAHEVLPPLTEKWARIMGVQPAGVRITSAKTCFGSCSAQNGICYSWRLMRYPAAAIEYVVVHELTHIRHKDHSAAFYAELARYLPDHKTRRALLRQSPVRP